MVRQTANPVENCSLRQETALYGVSSQTFIRDSTTVQSGLYVRRYGGVIGQHMSEMREGGDPTPPSIITFETVRPSFRLQCPQHSWMVGRVDEQLGVRMNGEIVLWVDNPSKNFYELFTQQFLS